MELRIPHSVFHSFFHSHPALVNKPAHDSYTLRPIAQITARPMHNNPSLFHSAACIRQACTIPNHTPHTHARTPTFARARPRIRNKRNPRPQPAPRSSDPRPVPLTRRPSDTPCHMRCPTAPPTHRAAPRVCAPTPAGAPRSTRGPYRTSSLAQTMHANPPTPPTATITTSDVQQRGGATRRRASAQNNAAYARARRRAQ